jgi:hypothetical protein
VKVSVEVADICEYEKTTPVRIKTTVAKKSADRKDCVGMEFEMKLSSMSLFQKPPGRSMYGEFERAAKTSKATIQTKRRMPVAVPAPDSKKKLEASD